MTSGWPRPSSHGSHAEHSPAPFQRRGWNLRLLPPPSSSDPAPRPRPSGAWGRAPPWGPHLRGHRFPRGEAAHRAPAGAGPVPRCTGGCPQERCLPLPTSGRTRQGELPTCNVRPGERRTEKAELGHHCEFARCSRAACPRRRAPDKGLRENPFRSPQSAAHEARGTGPPPRRQSGAGPPLPADWKVAGPALLTANSTPGGQPWGLVFWRCPPSPQAP